MRRRSLLLAGLAALCWPLLGIASPMQGLRPRGQGSFRRFGFHVYDATLWTGEVPDGPPLALRLDYRRKLSGQAIADASTTEMRRLVGDVAQLAAWDQAMRRIFPDVRDGDHLLGVWRDDGAYFYQNDALIGAVRDPAFARAFFGIWLDPRSSAPALRAALLGRG
ncbi:MAG: chalcone isomerase family protein [Dechloromonas sp.]|nr:chalcone isomerase family protein [Dechloromonas sp.]